MNIVCIEMEIRELIGIMNDSLNIVCIEIQSIPPWNLWVWTIWRIYPIYIPILMITFTLWTPGESSGSCWRLHQRHQGGDCGAGSCHQERGNWYIWRFPKVGVPPNHPFIDGFSTINHPFWGTPVYFTHTHWNLSHKHWNFHQHKTTFDPQTLRFSQYPWLCILGAYRCG